MPSFALRPTQNKMIAEVSKTLSGDYPNTNPILCVEAPTGTGKTLAYLLSAIPIAKAKDKKLIVSSANVALQEQLLNKDILEVAKHTSLDFQYALVKGRSRYLCVRNLINLVEDRASENPLFDDSSLWDSPPEKYQLKQLSEMLDNYSNQQFSGEIDDLEYTPEQSLWQKIACNRFTCTAKRCEFYHDCAFFKARKNINNADVLITNHDLVLADLSTGNSILPKVEDAIFIFDEAHHLNRKALSHFSLSSSTEHIKTTVRKTLGTVEQVCKVLQKPVPDMDIKALDEATNFLIQALKKLDYDEDIHLFEQGVVGQSILELFKNLSTHVQKITRDFDNIHQSWFEALKSKSLDKNLSDQLTNALGECEQHLSTIQGLFVSILSENKKDQAPFARWIEKSKLANKKTNYLLHSAQIDVSLNLDKLIWSKASGVILTSATLSSLGSFERLNQQLGLTQEQNQYLRLPSVFELSRVDFIIAKMRYDPTQVFDHTHELAEQLLDRIDENEGSLVLFASNKQMQTVADLIENKIGCSLFVQGEYSKKRILEKHTELRNQAQGSVIFGLDSFAEGVDLKGDNLTHVLIAKLRFSVPTSPIEKTTQDYLQSQNRNPFMEVSLPDASLKLIQACGRLIRTETDHGKITIFDNRITGRFYGKQLLNALPEYNIVVE